MNDPLMEDDEELSKRVQKQPQSKISSSNRASNTNTYVLEQSNVKAYAISLTYCFSIGRPFRFERLHRLN
jgi:hypothetical protein